MGRPLVVAARLLLGFGLIVGAFACQYQSPNGQSCLKDSDCESNTCVYGVCTDVNAGHGTLSDAATSTPSEGGTATEAGSDAPASETSVTDSGSATDAADAATDG